MKKDSISSSLKLSIDEIFLFSPNAYQGIASEVLFVAGYMDETDGEILWDELEELDDE